MTDRYFANQRIRHSVTREYYEAGQEIPVDHVVPSALDALVARGVLTKVSAPAVEPTKAAEVKPEPVIEAEPVSIEQVGPLRPFRSSKKIEEDKDNV